MHTRTLLAAMATAAVAAIATPSLSNAQDTTKATSKGEVAMKPNFGSLISAINSSAAQSEKLKGLTTVNPTDVTLVNVQDLLKGNDQSALEAALKKNDADITTLRGSVTANTAIAGALTGGVESKDVIAADVGADGKVTLFYWKK